MSAAPQTGNRRCQPFGVSTQTATPIGSHPSFGDGWFDPFLDLQLVGFAGDARLVALSDTHRDSEKEMSCVTRVLTGTAKCL
jgi:hypothetical protein